VTFGMTWRDGPMGGRSGVITDEAWVGWHPGSFEDGLAQGVYHVAAVLGGRGEVSADSVAVFGALFAGEPAGDVLLHFAEE